MSVEQGLLLISQWLKLAEELARSRVRMAEARVYILAARDLAHSLKLHAQWEEAVALVRTTESSG